MMRVECTYIIVEVYFIIIYTITLYRQYCMHEVHVYLTSAIFCYVTSIKGNVQYDAIIQHILYFIKENIQYKLSFIHETYRTLRGHMNIMYTPRGQAPPFSTGLF